MELRTDRDFYGSLIKEAVPIALQSLVSFATVTVGNMMVSTLGEAAVCSVYIANQLQVIIQFLSLGIESALVATAGQALGSGDRRRALSFAFSAFILSLLISAAIALPAFIIPNTVLSFFENGRYAAKGADSYLRFLSFSFLPFAASQIIIALLRSAKKTKPGFLSSLLSLAVNVLLSYAFISGSLGAPKLGTAGAGIAVLISRFAELSVLIIYCLLLVKRRRIKIKTLFTFDLYALKSFWKTAYPLTLSQAVWCINSFFSAYILARQSPSYTIAAAASATALYNFAYIISGAVSASLGIKTARLIGSGNGGTVLEKRRELTFLFLLLGALSALTMQVGKYSFIRLWNMSEESAPLAESFINILSLAVIATSYQSAMLGIIKSAKETKFILTVEAFSVLVLIIPVTMLLNCAKAGTRVIFAALKCDQIAKCPIAYFKLKKLKVKNS